MSTPPSMRTISVLQLVHGHALPVDHDPVGAVEVLEHEASAPELQRGVTSRQGLLVEPATAARLLPVARSDWLMLDGGAPVDGVKGASGPLHEAVRRGDHVLAALLLAATALPGQGAKEPTAAELWAARW